MTMYIDATRLTFDRSAIRSRLLINRDHIVTVEEVPRGIHITTVNGSKYLVEATYEDAIEAVNKQERTEEIQEELLLTKAAQKVAQAFENLAKRASETISEIFKR